MTQSTHIFWILLIILVAFFFGFYFEQNKITGFVVKDSDLAYYGKYSVKPSFKISSTMNLSIYEEIKNKVKEIIEYCSTREKIGKDLKLCVKDKVASYGWTLNYCKIFSPSEEACLDNKKLPIIDNGNIKCVKCPKECKEYKNERYCNLDPCNLNCEWVITSCVKKEEVRCTNEKSCEDYKNEKYCILDPCNFRCYPKIKKGNLVYDKCVSCDKVRCEDYKTEEYCNLDLCELGCEWDDNCREGVTKKFNPDRVFRICVTTQKKFLVYDKMTNRFDLFPLGIKFAISIPDSIPPKPLTIDVQDNLGAEDSIILTWDKSPEKDVDYYIIYFSTQDFIDKEIVNHKIKDVDKIIVKDFEVIEDINLNRCEFEVIGAPCIYKGYKQALKKGNTYFIKSNNKYVYILNDTKDYVKYYVAVTAVDVYGNEINNIAKEQKLSLKNYKEAFSIDDLPPNLVELIGIEYKKNLDKILLKWRKVITNLDGTMNKDLAGYKIYYSNKKFEDVTNAIEISSVAPCQGCEIEMTEIDTSNLEGTYYFGITAYDKNGNEYKKVKENIGIKLEIENGVKNFYFII